MPASDACSCQNKMPSKKNKGKRKTPSIHPNNKYAHNPPDFAFLASLYPSFQPFVFYSRDGRPRIDWTDFSSTRQLTRVLLLHDHGLDWWIPDGQLCPTVPNRSNYIHWIEDLLSSDIIPKVNIDGDAVKGFDIGTGANCIYPLLGASLFGWSFVGSDVTDIAIEWAERNVRSNLHISELIEIRKVTNSQCPTSIEDSQNVEAVSGENEIDANGSVVEQSMDANKNYFGPSVLVGVVKDNERFDFCMCNPPFFESMEEAGLNPKTSCGGTPEEMVCPGGERAFIARIIEDGAVLKESFRWYTSMVGRKINLKFLISKLREVGVTIVRTTEFVQGQTCRWGLAWSFVPPARKIISAHVAEKNIFSFTLEGLQHQFSALDVLQSVESFFSNSGASCKLNSTTFVVHINASVDQCDAILNKERKHCDETASCNPVEGTSNCSIYRHPPLQDSSFRISVFQQIPGTLLVKASLQHKDSPVSGVFPSVMEQLEETLRCKFCRAKPMNTIT